MAKKLEHELANEGINEGRRNFLKASLALTGAVALSGCNTVPKMNTLEKEMRANQAIIDTGKGQVDYDDLRKYQAEIRDATPKHYDAAQLELAMQLADCSCTQIAFPAAVAYGKNEEIRKTALDDTLKQYSDRELDAAVTYWKTHELNKFREEYATQHGYKRIVSAIILAAAAGIVLGTLSGSAAKSVAGSGGSGTNPGLTTILRGGSSVITGNVTQ